MVSMLQRVCIVAVGMGIAVEFVLGADLGYILISVGSLCFAVATKIHALEEKAHREK